MTMHLLNYYILHIVTYYYILSFFEYTNVNNGSVSFILRNMYYVYLEMVYNLQSDYNYTTKIKQLCLSVIFVHIGLVSCNFVGSTQRVVLFLYKSLFLRCAIWGCFHLLANR